MLMPSALVLSYVHGTQALNSNFSGQADEVAKCSDSCARQKNLRFAYQLLPMLTDLTFPSVSATQTWDNKTSSYKCGGDQVK